MLSFLLSKINLNQLLTEHCHLSYYVFNETKYILWRMKMTKREMLRSLIKATNSMIFSIHFVKKNGELREMVAKDGVEKHLVHPKGEGSNRQEHCPNLITLFDMQAGSYKSVNLDTVVLLKCGNKIVWEE